MAKRQMDFLSLPNLSSQELQTHLSCHDKLFEKKVQSLVDEVGFKMLKEQKVAIAMVVADHQDNIDMRISQTKKVETFL